jgi:hypothetical protein
VREQTPAGGDVLLVVADQCGRDQPPELLENRRRERLLVAQLLGVGDEAKQALRVACGERRHRFKDMTNDEWCKRRATTTLRQMPWRTHQSSWISAFSAGTVRPSVGGMPSYLVETYLARRDDTARCDGERRARRAAAELTREGTSVRFDRSIYVPEDEICFYVFHAPSGSDAARTADLARLDALRVVEAVSSGEEF